MNSQFNSNAMGAIAYLLLPLVFATFDLVQSPFSEKNAENLEKKVRKKNLSNHFLWFNRFGRKVCLIMINIFLDR